MKFRSIGVDPPRGLQPRRLPALSAQITALPFRALPLPLVNIATLLAFVLLSTISRAQSATDRFDTGTSRTPRVSAAQAAGKIGIKGNSTALSRGRQMPLIITSDYQYDDGSSEEAIGYGNGGQNFEAIWFDEFSVIPGKTNITCVQIAWGSPMLPQQINGTLTTIGIWGDPTGDGNPSDAALLGSVAGTISMSNTDTFINYAFSPPIDVSAFTHFFVGDLTPMNNGPELFFQAQDTDASQGRSWVAAMSSGAPADFNNLGNNDLLGTIDSFGTPGNWMIRVNAGGVCPTPTPGFQNTGGLATARESHTARLLPDGTVLVAGGHDSSTDSVFASAELYQPESGTWMATGSMANARELHTAILLPGGTVLVAGGFNLATALASAELYGVGSHTWTATDSLLNPRFFHRAIFLPNGLVLVAGGENTELVASAELYDPAGHRWMPTGNLINPRYLHTATFLNDGTVLVAGGLDINVIALATAELYDPVSQMWMPTGSLINARHSHTATLLPDGMVLVAGGRNTQGTALPNAELYDPAGHSWIPTGSLINPRFFHTATLLPNGMVLVAGGLSAPGSALANAELYDPASHSWMPTGSLAIARALHTATLLMNGNVLIAGGQDNTGKALASSELYLLPPGSNADLSDLNLSAGAILPAFDPDITRYTLRVATSTTLTTVTPTAEDSAATITVNGQTVVSGGTSSPIGLNVGDNTIDTIVTAQDGTTTRTYTVTVTRAPSSNANLSNLILSAGAISPAFNPNITNYTLSVPNSTASTTVTPTAQDPTATITVNGQAVSSGGTSNSIALNVGDTTIDTVVTAQDDTTTQTYTVAVTRVTGSPPVITSSLSASATVGQSFAYQITATNNPTSFGATPLPAGLTVDAAGLISGIPSLADSFDVTISATNSGGTGSAVLMLDISPPDPLVPDITSPDQATATGDKLFLYQIVASGLPTSYDATNLPLFLTIDRTLGIISGTAPSTGGDFTLTLSATNANGTGAQALTLSIQPTPPLGTLSIISGTSVTGATDRPFNFQVAASGATSAARVSSTVLPPGLALDPVSGLVFGTPTSAGSFKITFTVTDGGQTATAILELNLLADPKAPVIISARQATFLPGLPFSYTIAIQSSADRASTTFDLIGKENLPPLGLFFNQAEGTITGIPQARAGVDSPQQAGGIVGGIQITGDNGDGTANSPFDLYESDPGADNIATRLAVGVGDDALIGGFIIVGTASEKVAIRAIGPSLAVSGKLLDPILELHKPDGSVVTNDNWRDTQEEQIIGTTIPPTNAAESAIVATLGAGGYTAIVRGKNDTQGIALVEIYDLGPSGLDQSKRSRLANIATRGKVQTGDNVMIGGIIIPNGSKPTVVLRALGPSLANKEPPVAGPLQDPRLDLRDADGDLILSNDNWMDSPDKQTISDNGLAPTNEKESALVAIALTPGGYTAIVSGNNDTIGVALVDAYVLGQ